MNQRIPARPAFFLGIALCMPLAWSDNHSLPAQEAYEPQVGRLHPGFKLPSIETRQAVSLADYRGQKVSLPL
jgi:hypothetical protein